MITTFEYQHMYKHEIKGHLYNCWLIFKWTLSNWIIIMKSSVTMTIKGIFEWNSDSIHSYIFDWILFFNILNYHFSKSDCSYTPLFLKYSKYFLFSLSIIIYQLSILSLALYWNVEYVHNNFEYFIHMILSLNPCFFMKLYAIYKQIFLSHTISILKGWKYFFSYSPALVQKMPLCQIS